MAPKADEEERKVAEVRTGLVELVRDRFVVGDERSEPKAPAPDRNP